MRTPVRMKCGMGNIGRIEAGMILTFSIEPDSGSACIGEFRLNAFQPKAEIEPRVAHLVERSRDHGNGYAWLYLRGLSFGGQPAALSLGFYQGGLEQMGWSVTLPAEADENTWPSRKAIDAEVAFVRDILGTQTGAGPKWKSPMSFDWGEIWSGYDARADIASHGLRYRSA